LFLVRQFFKRYLSDVNRFYVGSLKITVENIKRKKVRRANSVSSPSVKRSYMDLSTVDEAVVYYLRQGAASIVTLAKALKGKWTFEELSTSLKTLQEDGMVGVQDGLLVVS